MVTLFPDNVLKKAKEAINNIECKGHSNSSSHKKGCYHPYESQEEGHDSNKKQAGLEEYQILWPWKERKGQV